MRNLGISLTVSAHLFAAHVSSFSIHEDLLAHPQFAVSFADGFISEQKAQRLTEDDFAESTASADAPQASLNANDDADAEAGGESSEGPAAVAYEIMNLASRRFLCSIPSICPPKPMNETANELAKAEEARERSRATTHGWELMNHLDASCLYFMSGWWSYRFCNNHEIVQFHPVAGLPNGQPPKRDPHTAEYVLGRRPTLPATQHLEKKKSDKAVAPIPAELQEKGNQRYLVQRLEGGTICDLTGRERTVEVQYHCVPGIGDDRIGWIKEVTICAYVMVVNTPRLCTDAAFMPPQESKANTISCTMIGNGNPEQLPLLDQQASSSEKVTPSATATSEASESTQAASLSDIVIGGVVVGARHVLSAADEDGKPPMKLMPPRDLLADQQTDQDRLIEILIQATSKQAGGQVTRLNREQLEKLNVKPEVIEQMKKQMERLAGESGWKLEIVEVEGGDQRKLRGYVDDGESEEESEESEESGESDGKENVDEAGSEEKFFKDEL